MNTTFCLCAIEQSCLGESQKQEKQIKNAKQRPIVTYVDSSYVKNICVMCSMRNPEANDNGRIDSKVPLPFGLKIKNIYIIYPF